MGMVPTCDVRSTAPRYSSCTKSNHGFDKLVYAVLSGGDAKFKLEMAYHFFLNKRVRFARADKAVVLQ